MSIVRKFLNRDIIWKTAKTLELKFAKAGFSKITEPGDIAWQVEKTALKARKAIKKARKAGVKKTGQLLFWFSYFGNCFCCNCAVFRPNLQWVKIKTNKIHNLLCGIAHTFSPL